MEHPAPGQTIGNFLAALRSARGLTQQEVADAVYVSNKTVSKWERGESAPDISLLPALAEFFGVTCDELLRGRKAPQNAAPASPQSAARTEEQLRRLGMRILAIFRVGAALCAVPVLVGLPLFFALYDGDVPYTRAVTGRLCWAVFLPLWAAGTLALLVLFSLLRPRLAALPELRRRLQGEFFAGAACAGAALLLPLTASLSRGGVIGGTLAVFVPYIGPLVYPTLCWMMLRLMGAAGKRWLPPWGLAPDWKTALQCAAWLPAAGYTAYSIFFMRMIRPQLLHWLLAALTVPAGIAAFLLRRKAVRALPALALTCADWAAAGALFLGCGALAVELFF